MLTYEKKVARRILQTKLNLLDNTSFLPKVERQQLESEVDKLARMAGVPLGTINEALGKPPPRVLG